MSQTPVESLWSVRVSRPRTARREHGPSRPLRSSRGLPLRRRVVLRWGCGQLRAYEPDDGALPAARLVVLILCFESGDHRKALVNGVVWRRTEERLRRSRLRHRLLVRAQRTVGDLRLCNTRAHRSVILAGAAPAPCPRSGSAEEAPLGSTSADIGRESI